MGLESDAALHDMPQPLLKGIRAVGECRPAIGHDLLQARRTLRDAKEDAIEAVQEEPRWVVPRRCARFGQRVRHRQ